RTGDDEPRSRELAAHVEPVLPGQIEHRAARNTRCRELLRDVFDLPLHYAQATGGADEAGVLPHHIAQSPLQRIEIAARTSQRRLGVADCALQTVGAPASLGDTNDRVDHHVAGDPAEYRGLGDAVAAEAVGAVHAAGVFASGKEAFDAGAAGRIDDDTAHHEVSSRSDLDRAAREVPTEVATASHQSSKGPLDDVGAEVRNVDPHAAVGR